MLKMWQLLDYRGKQRLQFLVFPSGMRYDKGNDKVLIPEVNKIMFAIAELSKVLSNPEYENSEEDKEKLRQVYLAFLCSNYFWTELLKIIAFVEYIETIHSSVWKSVICTYYNPVTGTTQDFRIIYVSDSTETTYSSPFGIESGTTLYVGIPVLSGTSASKSPTL